MEATLTCTPSKKHYSYKPGWLSVKTILYAWLKHEWMNWIFLERELIEKNKAHFSGKIADHYAAVNAVAFSLSIAITFCYRCAVSCSAIFIPDSPLRPTNEKCSVCATWIQCRTHFKVILPSVIESKETVWSVKASPILIHVTMYIFLFMPCTNMT